jgi:hypothetical protein
MRYTDSQPTRDLASLLKKISVTDRTIIGHTLRKTFGKAVPPRIVRLDPRVARMSMRVALYATTEVQYSVVASIGDRVDRMFVDVPTDRGHAGILTYRENGVLHFARVDFVEGQLSMCKLGAELTATDEESEVDWGAISCGRWEADPGQELFWMVWERMHICYRAITHERQDEQDVRDAIADGLLPDMISVALACALPQLSLDDPAIQDRAQAPVAGRA